MKTCRIETRGGQPVALAPAPPPVPLGTRMVVSALGGMGAATLCHPLDVVRIQMQLYSFKSSFDAAQQIVAKSGPRSLYNGCDHVKCLADFIYSMSMSPPFMTLPGKANPVLCFIPRTDFQTALGVVTDTEMAICHTHTNL